MGTPYVRVLTDIWDRFGRYNVALIDREQLRLFSVVWGQIQAETETFGEEIKRHKQGGWASARYQRHADHLALHNLKQAVELIEEFTRQTGTEKLMLGGSAEVRAQAKELMSKWLLERIIGEFPVEMDASPSEVLERSLDILAQADLEEEKELVARAITEAAKGRAGVIGLDDTLWALHEGRVHVLLVEENFRAPGFICRNCGFVMATRRDECPFCGHKDIAETPDAVNLAIQKAIETGSGVNIVRQNPELTKAGGIAALLRY